MTRGDAGAAHGGSGAAGGGGAAHGGSGAAGGGGAAHGGSGAAGGGGAAHGGSGAAGGGVRRRALAAAGVFAAALVAGAAVAVGFGLHTGFERSANRSDLPDITARFSPQRADVLDARVRGLPNLASASYRDEIDNVPLRFGRHTTRDGRIEVLLGGRRGYAIVAGRDLRRRGEVVLEQGVADAWGIHPGDTLDVGRAGPLPVVGIAVAPDNVAFPLAKTAKLYVLSWERDTSRSQANQALLWAHDRSRLPILLAGARTEAFGLGNLTFVTREGMRLQLDRAAGIVISLLVAFALVALLAAGTMLAAGAHADVQRRLPSLGVRRALGFSPGAVVRGHAREAVVIAVPTAAVGVALGALAVSGPARSLLETLNEAPPGAAVVGPLALAWVAIVALVVVATVLPARRAAGRPIVALLRGGELAPRRRMHAKVVSEHHLGVQSPSDDAGGAHRARTSGPDAPPAAGRWRPATPARDGSRAAPWRRAARARDGGLLGMGTRFATAARARWAGSVATLAVCAGIVLLMLGLASLLVRLRDDPAILGKKYQLTVNSPVERLPEVRGVPGVQAATQRYFIQAADAFRLGEPVNVIAFRGDHTEWDAPPLASGRRIRAQGEAEVGQGLADELGLRPGSPLATLDPSGSELRLKVVGIVRSIDNNGRTAWVTDGTLLANEKGGVGQTVIRLTPGASRSKVVHRLDALGLPPQRVTGATTRNRAFLDTLASVLRAIAGLVGLVCLYALTQGLAMTARERRTALAVLRASGAGRLDVAAVLTGAAIAVALPAAIGAVALERLVLGPVVTHLAASYAALPLRVDAGQIGLVAGGLALLAALAAWAVSRRLSREPVVRGLREG